jgi:rRNA maturation RNase YbeY
MSHDITFHTTENIQLPFKGNEKSYIDWLHYVAAEEKSSITSLAYIFCSDEYLLDINIKYLGHDYYTDIITFPYVEKHLIESDLYISVDRVKENAEDFEIPFENELLRVMVHGLLHLIGYSDKRDDDIHMMRQKEDFYISQFDHF